MKFMRDVLKVQLSLLTASELGFEIPNSFIINTGNAEDQDILFATQRYDRISDQSNRSVDGLICPLRLHQEDFGQALGIASTDKYEQKEQGIFRSMFDLLRIHAADPINDQLRLWDSIVFHYLLGNTDCHVKNFALLYDKDLKGIRLSPMYDVISTIVYSGINRDMPFYIGGEKRIDRIERSHFETAAKDAGLGQKMVMRRFDALKDNFRQAITLAAEKLMDDGYHEANALKAQILTRNN